jgi:molybdopterin-guanine dinucleotide biosynthesis protein A
VSDEEIQDLARTITEKIPPQYKVGFAHVFNENTGKRRVFNAEYVQKNKLHYINLDGVMGAWQYRDLFAEMDIVLVNGNHFKVVNTVDASEDLNDILKKILSNIQLPVIKGLVLAGGRSTRMGHDKGKLNYHGKPQREFVADMLENMGIEAYISCRDDQKEELANYRTVTDSFNDMGPVGGILSAMLFDPNAAWLVVACDLPLVTEGVLKTLLQNRFPSAIATAFRSPSSIGGTEGGLGFPEPLITLWEPKALPVIMRFLSQGVMCPRKVLINSDTHLLPPPSVVEALMNANTPEDAASAKHALESAK